VAVASSGCVVYADGSEGSSSSSSTDWTQEDVGPHAKGQIDATWQVGADGCEAAGVETVEIVHRGVSLGSFPCADGEAVVDAPPDRGVLELTGSDADGVVRYAGEVGRVRVYAGQTTTAPTVLLEPLPATVAVTWYFENGHLCSANGIQEVEIDLFDANDVVQHQGTTSCDDGRFSFDGVEPGTWSLLLLGRTGHGDAAWRASADLELQGGDSVREDLMLSAAQ